MVVASIQKNNQIVLFTFNMLSGGFSGVASESDTTEPTNDRSILSLTKRAQKSYLHLPLLPLEV